MQLESFLEASARSLSEKTALVSQGERFSYGEIDRLSNRLAHALRAEGVRRGDRVAIFLDNSVEAVIAIFAVLKLGAVFVVINPTTKTEKLSYLLNDCRAVGLISYSKLGSMVSAAVERVESIRLLVVVGPPMNVPAQRVETRGWRKLIDSQQKEAERAPEKSAIDIDLAAIIYTSGSTGFPKGVMMTHLNMVTASSSIVEYLESRAEDVILNVLPLSFDYGLYQVFMAFKVGATVILERSFAYPHLILEQLAQEKVTGFPIVPTMAALLLQMSGSVAGRFPHLRYITNTAAALPPAHIEKLRSLFPATRIYSMYGLTECKRVSYLPPDQLDKRPTSVGKAIPNTEVYIVDERGARVGAGEVGELVVRGGHVTKGYWDRKEETDLVLKPGPVPGEKVLYTGDLFKMDAEGYLYFMGRKDDIIKTRGEKVSPREVEAVLYGLSEVMEAQVIGIQDEVLGHAVKAVIALVDGAELTEQEVMRHCARHLEDFMVPQFVEFRKSLPKTVTGKISKLGLAKLPEVSRDRPAVG